MGGAGADQIWISASDSRIDGGSVNGNSAFADGGDDNDQIRFGSLQNQATIIGGTGDDYIIQQGFNNQTNYIKEVSIYADGLSGETVDDGDDDISVNHGQIANINAGRGDDNVTVSSFAGATIDGGSGNDNLRLNSRESTPLDIAEGNYNLSLIHISEPTRPY